MAQTRYITVAELAEAYDARTLAQLGSDLAADSTVDESNAILLNAIERASAIVQSFALAAGLYTATDLTDLQTADDWSLKGLVAAIAMGKLFDRRTTVPPESIQRAIDSADETLKSIRKGRRVFNDADAIDAGKPSVVIISPTTRARLNLVSDQPFFPTRQRQQV